jgi:hypothetical protein
MFIVSAYPCNHQAVSLSHDCSLLCSVFLSPASIWSVGLCQRMLTSFACRSFRLHLLHKGSSLAAAAAAVATAPPRVCSPSCFTIRGHAAAAMSEPIAEKRLVRDRVKAALRQLSPEQMAEESAWLACPPSAMSALRTHCDAYLRLTQERTTAAPESACCCTYAPFLTASRPAPCPMQAA